MNNKIILSVLFYSLINGQDCLRGGVEKVYGYLPNAPKCWVKQEGKSLPSCFELLPDGKCPDWPGIYRIDEKQVNQPQVKHHKCKKHNNPTPSANAYVVPSASKYIAPLSVAKYAAPSSVQNYAVPSSVPKYDTKEQPKYETTKEQPKYKSPQAIEGRCTLPYDENIIPITPEASNKGWAMSPDQECKIGGWCPYACAPGMYSAQYDESARVSGPEAGSMNGGLRCEADGKLVKPFNDRPLCSPGMKNVFIDNRLGSQVSLCQTTYPGNEAMLIPTVAKPNVLQVINVPPRTYWQQTSSHFYINPVNSSQDECKWGQNTKPVGNWAPFVCGANEGFEGNTFVMITVNPEFIDAGLQKTIGKYYKLRIECDNAGCNNVNCEINVNDPKGKNCVTTVPKGNKARIVLTY